MSSRERLRNAGSAVQMMLSKSGMADRRLERNVVLRIRAGTLRAAFPFGLGLFAGFVGRMLRVPPWHRGPVDRRTIAVRRAALQPKRTIIVLPHARRMTVELFSAVKAPMFLVKIRPIATHRMLPKQIEFFVMRQRYIFHSFPFDSIFGLRICFDIRVSDFGFVLRRSPLDHVFATTPAAPTIQPTRSALRPDPAHPGPGPVAP
jgi:hypothetical protein